MSAEEDIFRIGELTASSSEALVLANLQARHHLQSETGLEYLLYGIARVRTASTESVLQGLNATDDKILEALSKLDGQFFPHVTTREIRFTPELEQTLDLAKAYAKEQRREAKPRDLLLASTWVPLTPRFGLVLHALGISYPSYRDIVQDAFRE